MATITWPTSIKVGSADYGVEFDVQMSVSRNGRIFTYGLSGARWVATLSFETELESMQRPAIEAMIMSLEGGANRLQMPHFGRPLPNGTLTGSPTLSATAAAGAKSVALSGCNGTLKAGDIIGINGQLVMVTADATPVASAMTVNFSPALRNSTASGTQVFWNQPSILWVPKSTQAGSFPYKQGKVRPSFSIELIEAY